MALTPKQRKAALERGLTVSLTPHDESKYLSANPKAAAQLFAKPKGASTSIPSLPADGRPVDVPADGLPRQTVDRQHYRQTVRRSYRQTPDERQLENPAALPADRKTEVNSNNAPRSIPPIPLAPIQWAIWEALREADVAGKLVTYRKLAVAANASIRGVRDALAVIKKEGGIRTSLTVRTADEQGMRIEPEATKPFWPASLKATKALLKRGANYRQTVDRQSPALPADGLRLSVSITEYIKQTDLSELLKLFAPEWNIRERTLVEIARSFPSMTLIEFRRSLLLLIDQVIKNQTPIKNYNAWLKAVFAKNEGPLVTERMIEAQLDHLAQRVRVIPAKTTQENEREDLQADFTALRRYVTATEQERAAIEKAAEEKAASALRVTPADKHLEIREQALIESARAFFAKIP